MIRSLALALLLSCLASALPAQEVAAVASPNTLSMRGVTLPLHSLDPDFDYGPSLRELPGLGVTHVCVLVKIYQTNGASAVPGRRLRRTPAT